MSDCKCCEGSCVKCKDIVDVTCCKPMVIDGDYQCVIPQPENPSTTMPMGARYDCDIFDICPIPPNTFTAEQLAFVEASFYSVMQYFPLYASQHYTGGCPCYIHIRHGRDSTCYERWASPTIDECGDCPKGPDVRGKSCGCDSNTPSIYKYWTPTLPSNCCPRTVEVILNEGTPEEEVTYATVYPKQILGTVPTSHPNFIRYGGQGVKGVDMDQVSPAYLEKLIALLCKLLSVFQKGGPALVIIEK